MSRCSNVLNAGAVVAALVASGMLAGCASDIYEDRRETIALGADDAVATNKVTQMIDPWPRDSANRTIPGNGQRVADAVERYRTNRVIPPRGTGTSATYGAGAAPAAAPASSASGDAGDSGAK